MPKNYKVFNNLPWFKFWTGNFKSKTDHLSNADVGAYVRLLVSYWDNNGLPFNERSLHRIAKIEPEDNVELDAILGEFFEVQDKTIRHEELDMLRVQAIGEEDANKRRTLPARLALAGQRKPVTAYVADPYIDIDEIDIDPETEYPDVQTDSQTEDHQIDRQTGDGQIEIEVEIGDCQTDSQTGDHQTGDCQTRDRQNERQMEDPDQLDAQRQKELRRLADGSGPKMPLRASPASTHQSVSLKPDGGAQGGAVPAASSAQSGISFRLKDGSSIPLSASIDQSKLHENKLTTLRQLAERFESMPETRVTKTELPVVLKQWLQPLRKAA